MNFFTKIVKNKFSTEKKAIKSFFNGFSSIPHNFISSAKEIKRVDSLCVLGLMVSFCIVSSMFFIYITPEIRISFSFLAYVIIGYLYGPVTGCFFGFIADIVAFFVFPTGGGYFFGYTLSAITNGFIWGLVLYKKDISVFSVTIARLLTTLFVNLGLNVYWSFLLTGKGFWLLFSGKIIKNVLLLPVEIFLAYFILNFVVSKIKIPRIQRRN